MISASDRSEAVQLIDEATTSGAKLSNACNELGITDRTYYRWNSQIKADGETQDQRPVAERPSPKNKITDIERQRIINTRIHAGNNTVRTLDHRIVSLLA